jgi:hypothetical protein
MPQLHENAREYQPGAMAYTEVDCLIVLKTH